MHARAAMRGKIRSAITGLDTTAGRVYKAPAAAVVVPALVLSTVTEEAEDLGDLVVRRIRFEVEARVAGGDVEATLDEIVDEVEEAVLSDIEIVGAAADADSPSVDRRINGEGEQTVGVAVMTFDMIITTDPADPTG